MPTKLKYRLILLHLKYGDDVFCFKLYFIVERDIFLIIMIILIEPFKLEALGAIKSVAFSFALTLLDITK